MIFEIPGREKLQIEKLVFDYNGTIAVDGKIKEATAQRLKQLARDYQLYVLTADTHGTAAKECQKLDIPIEVTTFSQGCAAVEKAAIIEKLGPENCAAFGNGYNDEQMLEKAKLGIVVLEEEGISMNTLGKADYVVKSICDGLDLFLKPERLIAGLRH